jgi:hypothetical protein
VKRELKSIPDVEMKETEKRSKMKSQTLEFGENYENINHNKESRRNRTRNENRHSIKPEIINIQ